MTNQKEEAHGMVRHDCGCMGEGGGGEGKTRVTLANIGGNIGKRKASRWPGERMEEGRYRVTTDEVRQSETKHVLIFLFFTFFGEEGALVL